MSLRIGTLPVVFRPLTGMKTLYVRSALEPTTQEGEVDGNGAILTQEAASDTCTIVFDSLRQQVNNVLQK